MKLSAGADVIIPFTLIRLQSVTASWAVFTTSGLDRKTREKEKKTWPTKSGPALLCESLKTAARAEMRIAMATGNYSNAGSVKNGFKNDIKNHPLVLAQCAKCKIITLEMPLHQVSAILLVVLLSDSFSVKFIYNLFLIG